MLGVLPEVRATRWIVVIVKTLRVYSTLSVEEKQAPTSICCTVWPTSQEHSLTFFVRPRCTTLDVNIRMVRLLMRRKYGQYISAHSDMNRENVISDKRFIKQ